MGFPRLIGRAIAPTVSLPIRIGAAIASSLLAGVMECGCERLLILSSVSFWVIKLLRTVQPY
ncbi:hypothetical protein N0Y54_42250 [Nostoc punctiforme UO1]|uniref:hypothetical protein n=1 Tax=Nostoc punctiforme TaxID=272131 RepID=UPI0030A71CEA